MSGIAIMMMVLFMVIIWGGLAASIVALRRNPDHVAGDFGDAQYASNDTLQAQEADA